jgi:FtsX extracellular domain
MSNQVEPRLRTALREAAAQVQPSADAWQVVSHRRTRRRRPRSVVPALAAAAVVAVVVALAVGVLAVRGDDPSVRTRAGEPKDKTPEQLLALEADTTVYMRTDAPTPEINALRDFLRRSPEVRTYAYVDKSTAYEDFKRIFRDRPDLVDSVDPSALPATFRIIVRDCATRPQLMQSLQAMPGVDEALVQLGLARADAERFNDSREPLPAETRGRCGDQASTATRRWISIR